MEQESTSPAGAPGGALRYAVAKSMKIWGGGEYVRTAREDYPVVTIVIPWTLGVEFGPRAPRRMEPFFRVGLGLYRLETRGDDTGFIAGPSTPYAYDHTFGGLNFGGGGHLRLGGRGIFELGILSHQIFGVQQSDIPSLGTVSLLNLQAGLGYSFR